MQKVGRNDPCPCGSGKKYKKCCEEKHLRKKINAQLLSETQAAADTTQKVQRLSSLFKHVPPPKSPEPPEEMHKPM